MLSPTRLERLPEPLGFAPIFLANLLPLVGVLWFGWEPATLVVIYTLELVFSVPFAGAKALFAQRPPRTDLDDGDGTMLDISSELTEKRGSVELVSWVPPIYPRNLPFATAVIVPAVWLGILIGVVFSNLFAVSEVIAQPEVVLSVGALAVGQIVETRRDYRRGDHQTASPYTVVETPARQAFFVVFVLFVTPGLSALGVEVVLGIVVLIKLLVEWSAYRATEAGGGRLTGWLAGPETTDETRDPVSIPDEEPDVCISTTNRAVIYTGVFDVLARLAPFLAMPFIILWFLSLTALGDDASGVLVIGFTLVVFGLYVGFLAANVLEFYLRYGPLEYRRYGDRLVAYDTLVDEPQWSASIDVLRDVQVVPDRFADRLFGTRTITVTTGWGDDVRQRDLGPVSEPDRLVEAFELPVRTTKLDPLRRLPVAIVVACLVCGVVAAVLLAVGPWISLTGLMFSGLVYGMFGIPFAALALRLVWVQAYPERSDRDRDREVGVQSGWQ